MDKTYSSLIFFSIVLMTMCNARYQFTYVDVGTSGRWSDGGTFNNCSLNSALSENRLQMPPSETLPGTLSMIGDKLQEIHWFRHKWPADSIRHHWRWNLPTKDVAHATYTGALDRLSWKKSLQLQIVLCTMNNWECVRDFSGCVCVVDRQKTLLLIIYFSSFELQQTCNCFASDAV